MPVKVCSDYRRPKTASLFSDRLCLCALMNRYIVNVGTISDQRANTTTDDELVTSDCSRETRELPVGLRRQGVYNRRVPSPARPRGDKNHVFLLRAERYTQEYGNTMRSSDFSYRYDRKNKESNKPKGN